MPVDYSQVCFNNIKNKQNHLRHYDVSISDANIKLPWNNNWLNYKKKQTVKLENGAFTFGMP